MQVIDRTQKRHLSYFDTMPNSWPGVCHVSFGEPYDAKLREVLISRVTVVKRHIKARRSQEARRS